MFFVGKINSSGANNVDPFQNPSIGLSSDANWAIGISSANEVEAYQYQAGNKIAATTWSAGQLVLIQARYDGTNISVRKGKGAWVNTPSATPLTAAGNFHLGINYAGSSYLGAELCEYGITDVAIADSILDKVADAMAAKWGVSV